MMIKSTEQAWKDYANRLREHWVRAAASAPSLIMHIRAGTVETDYGKEFDKWYEDHYLTEPMYPSQEYANNH